MWRHYSSFLFYFILILYGVFWFYKVTYPKAQGNAHDRMYIWKFALLGQHIGFSIVNNYALCHVM